MRFAALRESLPMLRNEVSRPCACPLAAPHGQCLSPRRARAAPRRRRLVRRPHDQHNELK